MNGIINVYKEKDYTSFDVVAKLRGILRTKKIGHTGTLDPNATGVLPICLGKATKVVDLLTNKDKTYKAEMCLGIKTDTQDSSGSILEEIDLAPFKEAITFEKVSAMLLSYLGEYEQMPPMYSAVRIDGIKLYELARQGIEVERDTRLVHIHDLKDIKAIDERHFEFTVSCSKGTYIRTLIHDVGEQLGVGAMMTNLVRTQVGPFSIGEALTIEQIRDVAKDGRMEEILISVESLFDSYPRLIVSEEQDKTLYNGNKLPLSLLNENNIVFSEELFYDEAVRFLVYDSTRKFIGVYKFDEADAERFLRVEKMFY